MHSATARCNFRDRAVRILLRAETTDNEENVVVAHSVIPETLRTYKGRHRLGILFLCIASRICYRRYGHVAHISRALPLFLLDLWYLCEHTRSHCASEARADIAVAFAWDIDCVVKGIMNECWNAWLRNISRHATLHEFYPEKGNAIEMKKKWKYCQLQIALNAIINVSPYFINIYLFKYEWDNNFWH